MLYLRYELTPIPDPFLGKFSVSVPFQKSLAYREVFRKTHWMTSRWCNRDRDEALAVRQLDQAGILCLGSHDLHLGGWAPRTDVST